MRKIVTAITAIAMAFSLIAQATPAAAHLPGYESEWRLQTQYETANPGDQQTTLVQFINTGTTTWTKGTSTQVDLAVCLPKPNDETCDVASPLASWAVNWLSATRYATQTEAAVAPGGIANFTYTYKVPAGTAAGFYTFNGDLVVSSIGGAAGRLHPRGYFHQVQVLGAAAASCTPTAITLSPKTANNQVGVTHTQTATVTCAIPTGGTTAPPSVGAQVTFIIDAPTGSLNADLTLTATTDANGVATVTFTRSNPDVDSITAYPTSTPAVRGTATKTWSAGASVITCTPTDAATLLAGTSRTYTVQVNSPTTGSASTNTVTVSQGTSDTLTLSATTLTPDSTGKALFSVSGANGTSGTPKASTTFTISGNATTYSATCGKTTFESVKPATITLTPDTTATNAMGAHRVYTVTAVDQFGAAFTGTLQASFTQLTDSDSTTTTTAVLDNAATTAPSSASTSTCATATGFSGNQKLAVPLSSNGTGYFQICASVADTGKTTTTATPIAWFDTDGNGVPGTGEAQDTGGTKTWEASTSTSAKLSPSSATNASSTDATAGTNNDSTGEERYRATVRDQSGNLITTTATSTVTFTVTNTGSKNIYITECANDATSTGAGTNTGTVSSATITPGSSATCTATITSGTTNGGLVEVDSNDAGSANIACSITMGSLIYTCTTATKTWVAAGTTVTNAQTDNQTATGTVVASDTAQQYYTISTTVGNFTIFYSPNDTYTVDGTTANMANFQANVTLGDQVTYKGTANAAVGANHQLTNK